MRERDFQYNESHPSPSQEGDVSLIFSTIVISDLLIMEEQEKGVWHESQSSLLGLRAHQAEMHL